MDTFAELAKKLSRDTRAMRKEAIETSLEKELPGLGKSIHNINRNLVQLGVMLFFASVAVVALLLLILWRVW